MLDGFSPNVDEVTAASIGVANSTFIAHFSHEGFHLWSTLTPFAFFLVSSFSKWVCRLWELNCIYILSDALLEGEY
jgi:hypothetical protein